MQKEPFRHLREELRALPAWDRGVAVLCFFTLALLLLQLGLFSYGRDQSIYALVAREMAHGAVPYRDVWDFKPPGIFFAYSLARAAFGESMLAPRLLEMLGIGAMSCAFLHLGNKLMGSWLVGLMAATIATLLHVQLEFWHTGQPESFGGVATVIVLALLISDFENPRRKAISELIVGALLGVAFLLKPPLAGVGMLAVAYSLKKERNQPSNNWQVWAPTLRFVTGASAVLLGCIAWFVANGGWSALCWTMFEFTPGYTKMGWQGSNAFVALFYATREAVLKFSFLVPVGLLALAVVKPVHTREREGISVFAGAALVQICGIALQAKFFPYHYAATLPLLAWLAGVGLYKIWLRARRHAVMGVLFLAAICWIVSLRSGVRDLPGTFWERTQLRTQYVFGMGEIASRNDLDKSLYFTADFNLSADRDVAERIANSTPPNGRIFVWGFEPAIYLFAQRPIASKYIYNVPQRVSWEKDKARDELLRALETLPELIVIQHHDIFPAVTGDALDSARALQEFPELETLIFQNYQAVGSVEDFDLYVPSAARYAQINAYAE